MKQASFMETMLNVDIQEREERKRKERFDGLAEESPAQSGDGFYLPEDTEFEFPDKIKVDEKTASGFMEHIIPGFGLGIGAGLPLLLSRMMGRLPMLGIASAAFIMKEPIEDFIEGFLAEGMKQLDGSAIEMSDEAKNALAGPLTSTVFWGGIGKVIGGKMGLGIALGGILHDSMQKYVESNDNELSRIITDLDPMYISAAVGIAAPSVLSLAGKAAKSKLDSIPADGSLMRGLTTSKTMLTRLGMAGLIYGAARIAGRVVENQFESEELGNAAEIFGSSLALGTMFGPSGMIVGAIAGIALSGGYMLIDYLQGRRDQIANAIKEDLDRKLLDADKMLEEGNIEGAKKKYGEVLSESSAEQNRSRQLATDQATREFMTGTVEDAKERLLAAGASAEEMLRILKSDMSSGGKTPEQIEDYILDYARYFKKNEQSKGNEVSFEDAITMVPSVGNYSVKNEIDFARAKMLGSDDARSQFNEPIVSAVPSAPSKKAEQLNQESSSTQNNSNTTVVNRGGDSVTHGGTTHTTNITNVIQSPSGRLKRGSQIPSF